MRIYTLTMPLGCLRLVLSHVTKGVCQHVRSTSPFPLLLPLKPQPYKPQNSYLGITVQHWTSFSTSVEDSEEVAESEPQKKKKKKHDSKAQVNISSVGRKIHQRHLQLLGEDGGNLGVMHRADVLRLMDEKGLKLVPINEHSDPPVYRLMSGKQIHEEQMKLREKQKAKAAGPLQVKELTLYSDIAMHDLDTKLRQVVHWLDKKHHIKLTLRAGGDGSDTLDTVLDQMVEKLAVPVGFVSKTKVVQEGRAATCILRPPSAKELQAAQSRARATKPEPGLKEPSSISQPDQTKDSQEQ